MLFRAVLVASLALALSGCAGWASEQPLIPADERDPVDLAGTYVSGSGSLRITPAADTLYLVQDADPGKEGEQPSQVAFDLLRSRRRPAGSPDAEPVRDYLVQLRWEDDLGEVSYLYSIVTIAGAGAGAGDADPGTVATFDMLCAQATLAFAIREEDGFCIFDDYLKLRAAAFDALAWHDDARIELSETRYRPSEPHAP